MTEYQMYEDIRVQMRGKVNSANDPGYVGIALGAIYETLKKGGVECLPFFIGDKHLYVRCDNLPFSSIKSVEFLASSNFLNCRIVAHNKLVELDGEKHVIAAAYVNIYRE